jgi:hypothetical protein
MGYVRSQMFWVFVWVCVNVDIYITNEILEEALPNEIKEMMVLISFIP